MSSSRRSESCNIAVIEGHRGSDEPSVMPRAWQAPKRFPTRTTAWTHVRVREVCAVLAERVRDGNAARVLANALAVIYRDGGDMLMIRDLAPDLDPELAAVALNETDEAASAAGRSYRPMRAGKAGVKICLILSEVTRLRIRTMWPVDETAAQRSARQVDAKRTADRERARAKRGRMPRAAYLATALTASRPWEAAGVSRRTWERRRAGGGRVAGVSTSHTSPTETVRDTPASSNDEGEHCDAAS